MHNESKTVFILPERCAPNRIYYTKMKTPENAQCNAFAINPSRKFNTAATRSGLFRLRSLGPPPPSIGIIVAHVCLSTINLSALGAAQDARICRDWRRGHLVSHWSLSCVTEVRRRSWRRWRDVWFWHLQRRTRLRGRWRHGCVALRHFLRLLCLESFRSTPTVSIKLA